MGITPQARNNSFADQDAFSFTDTAELFSLIESGKLKIAVSKVYDLADAKSAHEDLGSGKTTGKLLLKM